LARNDLGLLARHIKDLLWIAEAGYEFGRDEMKPVARRATRNDPGMEGDGGLLW
jgi:hypothetical protein